ncbi:hypothetical protein TRFO_14304 [Tritrichomonas foetus]|uniref:Uncharacterized protein n=1 Tax=Tritrichomonas foetus TaxID=1144522 RepID=A0A1J4KVT7_9EUKA|nr:hypothetical protein TRFO_14304 [Tritrichomonas foetus]|eukprot:OHT15258.1 hypothetical protein TRFO_14304 [Tritrichomonas foetus]
MEFDLSDYITPVVAMWFFFAFLDFNLWENLIESLRKKSTTQIVRALLIVVYTFIKIVEFILFVQMIRTSPRSDFGFWFSIFFPTIAFYPLFGRLLYGIYRAVRRNAFKIKSLRIYKKYRILIPSIQFVYSFAYSSIIGILASAAIFFVTYYIDLSFPKPKKVKSKRYKTV